MNERDQLRQPTELIYLPSPSWAPAFLALGIALAVCGTFAQGFMVRGWVWSILGAVIALAALRAIVASATRDFYRLPRRQRVRGAVLPVTTLRPPRRG